MKSFFVVVIITINSNNDRPDKMSVNLYNHFLLHISLSGWGF
jgi:hypothetical protein